MPDVVRLMSKKTFIFTVALILCFLTQTRAQITILKDSVQIGEQYYLLEEPELTSQYDQVAMSFYQKLRNKAIVSSYFSAAPKQRLKAKKDTLKALVADGGLREAGYGFEHYELFYNQSGLLNLSVSIQSYGSPFESRQAYCFDLITGEMVGKALFVNHKVLLKMLGDKLKTQKKGLALNLETLDQYEIFDTSGCY